MKKAVALLMTGVVCIGILIGCGNSDVEKNSTAVESMDEAEETLAGKIVVASNRTDEAEMLVAYAQKFMDLHPGTYVEFETIKEYDGVIATRIASGEAPDIFYVVAPINQSTYGDFFLPIDDLPFTPEDILFYESGRGKDGQLYVLPLTVAYCGMIYNKQAFTKAGIEDVPMTVDEFYQVCDKLQAAGITPVGTAFKDLWPIYAWCEWGGVNLTAGDERGENKYVGQDKIYDDVMLNSMNIVRELYRKGQLEKDIMSANWESFKIDMAQAKVAMHYSESWLPQQIVDAGAKREDIGMFPFPGARNIKVSEGKMWGISKNTESPELAKAFLAYMLENPFSGMDVPSNRNINAENPFVDELLSYGVDPLSPIVGDATFSNVKNEIGLDGQNFFLTYVMEPDDAKAQAMVEEWNVKWAEQWE